VRLSTISVDQGTAAAVVLGDSAAVIADEHGQPVFADVGSLLQADTDGWAQAVKTAAAGHFRPLDPARLLRPILHPSAIVCVGLNYRTHILEMGRELPKHPTYFAKLARALTDPNRDIALPRASQRVDYEGELVAVIGGGGRDIPAAHAWEAVAGLTLMNDVSMRDFQSRTLQWFAGKNWERSTPVGPAIVTRDELAAFEQSELRVAVNGEARQQSKISDLVFDIPALVADLSRIVELRPGDLIATGTSAGVGDAMEPQRYLADGDVVEVTVDGLGTLQNTFRQEPC